MRRKNSSFPYLFSCHCCYLWITNKVRNMIKLVRKTQYVGLRTKDDDLLLGSVGCDFRRLQAVNFV